MKRTHRISESAIGARAMLAAVITAGILTTAIMVVMWGQGCTAEFFASAYPDP